jgi:hypothetical protein
MTRRLLNLLTSLSLLLCVAICGLWVRSDWVQDRRELTVRGQSFDLWSSDGSVGVDNERARGAAQRSNKVRWTESWAALQKLTELQSRIDSLQVRGEPLSDQERAWSERAEPECLEAARAYYGTMANIRPVPQPMSYSLPYPLLAFVTVIPFLARVVAKTRAKTGGRDHLIPATASPVRVPPRG